MNLKWTKPYFILNQRELDHRSCPPSSLESNITSLYTDGRIEKTALPFHKFPVPHTPITPTPTTNIRWSPPPTRHTHTHLHLLILHVRQVLLAQPPSHPPTIRLQRLHARGQLGAVVEQHVPVTLKTLVLASQWGRGWGEIEGGRKGIRHRSSTTTKLFRRTQESGIVVAGLKVLGLF